MCIKAAVRRGEVLMQLQQYREASDAFRSGLQVDLRNRALNKGFRTAEGCGTVAPILSYGHTNASTEIAGDPTDAQPVSQFTEASVNLHAQHDSEISEVLVQAGMVFDATDILKVEAQWWSTHAARFMSDVNNA